MWVGKRIFPVSRGYGDVQSGATPRESPFLIGLKGDGNRRTHRPSLRHRRRPRRGNRTPLVAPLLYEGEETPGGFPSREVRSTFGNRRLSCEGQDPSCSPLGGERRRGPGFAQPPGTGSLPRREPCAQVSGYRFSPVKGKTPLVLPCEGRDAGVRCSRPTSGNRFSPS